MAACRSASTGRAIVFRRLNPCAIAPPHAPRTDTGAGFILNIGQRIPAKRQRSAVADHRRAQFVRPSPAPGQQPPIAIMRVALTAHRLVRHQMPQPVTRPKPAGPIAMWPLAVLRQFRGVDAEQPHAGARQIQRIAVNDPRRAADICLRHSHEYKNKKRTNP